MNKASLLHLSSKQLAVWNAFARKLLSAQKIFLFLDYDGTITPIQKMPGEAYLSAEAIELLQELLQLPAIHLMIVTGRSMEDIRKFIPLQHITFIANHGLHILHENKEWKHPEAVPFIPVMENLYAVLQHTLLHFTQAFVEDKQLTLSIHYRNVPADQVNALKALAGKTITAFDGRLLMTEGKEVLEVRPPVQWGKGHAVTKMIKAHHTPAHALHIYIGDDKTDEDAFQVLRKSGITIHVGKTPHTNAQYYSADVSETLQILQLIVSLQKKHPGSRITSWINK